MQISCKSKESQCSLPDPLLRRVAVPPGDVLELGDLTGLEPLAHLAPRLDGVEDVSVVRLEEEVPVHDLDGAELPVLPQAEQQVDDLIYVAFAVVGYQYEEGKR